MRLFLISLISLLVGSAAAEPFSIGKILAVDGDTVRLDLRLLDCDTPETSGRAKCAKEHELGMKAKQQLQEMLKAAGTRAIEFVECDCPSEQLGTLACNHGRACGRLLLDGKNVCEALIHGGLARSYQYSRRQKPPPARWCD